MKRAGFIALLSLGALYACGDEAGRDADEPDSGETPRADGGRRDGGGTTTRDAGPDSGSRDAGRDSGRDASAPNDAGDDEDAGDEDAGDEDAGEPDGSAPDGGEPDASSPDAGPPDPPVGAVWLNEVLADPPGTDNNNEFIEFGCQPGLALDPYWFVIADGDTITNQPNAIGVVTFKKKLTGITCGQSGLVVLQRGGVYDGIAGTTFVKNFFADNIQNGSQTYLLVQRDTFDATDVDVDNDGVLDDDTLQIADSVAVLDGTVGDAAYSTAVLEGGEIDAISRFAGTTLQSTASWYFGAVIAPSPYSYDPVERSPNFPAGGTLSPGQANTALP